MTSILNKVPSVIFLAVVGTLAGCGSASNNDQGTTFTAIGFFQDGTGAAGDTGSIIALGRDVPNISTSDPNFADEPLLVDGQQATTFIGLQNRFLEQADGSGVFVRTDRVDCDYEIPGSDIFIPGDSNPLGQVIEPGGRSFSEFLIISPDLFSFLNVNRNSLPQLPFRMTAICRAVGVSRTGDTITTNNLNYLIVVADSAECCTGSGVFGAGGFQEGAGTGGTQDTFGGETVEIGGATGTTEETEETEETADE